MDEDVSGVLSTIEGKLPSADFEIGDLDEDSDGSESLGVFSRTEHLKLMGIEDLENEQDLACANLSFTTASNDPDKSLDGNNTESNITTVIHGHVTDESLEAEGGTITGEKSAFFDVLQMSEQELEEDQNKESQHKESLRQQMVINAITSMHSSVKPTDTDQEEATTDTSVTPVPVATSPTADADIILVSPMQKSKTLLSVIKLETIHESELDKVLESMESEEPVAPERKSEGPPPPKIAWASVPTNNDTLMKQLEQLSHDQSKRQKQRQSATGPPTYAAVATPRVIQEPITSPTHHLPKGTASTVFLDLRPPSQAELPSVTETDSSARPQERSGSESDGSDDDDPYSWISQRQQIKKESLQSPTLQMGPGKSAANSELSSWKERLNAGRYTKDTSHNLPQVAASSPSIAEKVEHAETVLPLKNESSASVNGSTEEGILHEEDPLRNSSCSSLSGEEMLAQKENQALINRQRSTDSLTLSSELSSHSESESSSQSAGANDTKTSSKPPICGKGKKANVRKHMKKSRKGGDKGKGAQSQKKRPQLQLYRTESYTTSSDEERLLEPAKKVAGDPKEPVATSQNQGGVQIIDIEKLKVKLQRKIELRKPPSHGHFETPATTPLFHLDVSFDPLLTSMDPTVRTDALLVLPLSDLGLVLLPECFSDLSIPLQQVLNTLLLTWLATTAAVSATKGAVVNGRVPSNSEEPSPCSAPFRITGMQQTVLDGNPVITLGVATPQGRKGTHDSSHISRGGESFNQGLEIFLQKTTLAEFIHPLLDCSTVSKSISASVQAELEPVFQLPLAAIFSLQDDHSPLTTAISFYWYSQYHPSCLPASESLKSHTRIQTTVCTIGCQTLSQIDVVFSILHSIACSGLDLAGIRLVYGESSSSIDSSSQLSTSCNGVGPHSPMLALAMRGPDAICQWLEVVGPEDSSLAKITDPCSLNATFGIPGRQILHCVRTPYRASAALAKWFGGKACLKTGSVLGVSDAHTKSERRKRQRVRFSESESEDNLPSPLPDVTFPPLICNRPLLVAHPYSKIFLVVSPRLPPSCYSSILASCSKLGYDIFGVKRVRLNSKRANALHILPSSTAHFTPSSTPSSPAVVDDLVVSLLLTQHIQNAPPLPSMLLILGRENAILHTDTLKNVILRDLSALIEQHPAIQTHVGEISTPDAIVHTTAFSSEPLKVIGDFTTVPNLGISQMKLASAWDRDERHKEENSLVAITHNSSLDKVIDVLNAIFHIKSPQGSGYSTQDNPEPEDMAELGGLELLGMKFIPQLSRYRAKQLCPLSAGDLLYQQALQVLSDTPAMLLLLRGINTNERLHKLLPQRSKPPLHSTLESKLQVIISSDMSEAFHLTETFFTDKELFCDANNWVLAPYVPPSRLHEDIQQSLQRDPETLYSVLTVRIDQTKLLIKVLEKLFRAGFHFVGMTLQSTNFESVLGSEGQLSEARIAVCVEKTNAVWLLMHELKPFTISSVTCQQALSYSESFASAIQDIRHNFPKGICCQPTSITRHYDISCPVYDDFIDLLDSPQPPSSKGSDSPLLETTCIVLPSSLLPLPEKPGSGSFITAMDLIAMAGFEVCGLRMTQLSEDKARALCFACTSEIKVKDVVAGPCLIMVLRRNNAASCFPLILKRSATQSNFRESFENVEWLLAKMIVPINAKEATQVMKVFEQ